MKGNFKITVIDLDSKAILIDDTVDELDFRVNRPVEAEYGNTPDSFGRPTGFRQSGPLTYSIEGKQNLEEAQ